MRRRSPPSSPTSCAAGARSCGPPEQKMIEGVIYTPSGSARNFLEKGQWIDLTVGEALTRTAARVPERIAFASEEGELTFRQLDERSARLGAALLDLGVRPGERAMFQMGTVLDTVVALSACFKAGIIPVCSVPQYREVEIGQLARLSGATLYFVQADFGSFDLVGFARGMQQKLPSLRHLIVARGRTDDQKRLIQSISLEAARRRLSQVKLTPEDCFVFQLSGGSTGVPKIIPRFHGEYLAHCDSWNRMHGMDEGSVAIWSLPIVHNAGQIFGYMGAIHWGRTTVLTSRIDIAHILDMIAKYRVTNAMSIGPTAQGFVRTGDLAKAHRIEGRLYYSFEGRLKDNINRGGEKFGTEEVENFIRQHPAVADVAVVAMPDEMLIERACAYLVPRPGEKAPDVRTLGAFLEAFGLAKFKFPERIEVVNAFPVTRVGKLDKAQLRKAIAEKLAREKNAAA